MKQRGAILPHRVCLVFFPFYYRTANYFFKNLVIVRKRRKRGAICKFSFFNCFQFSLKSRFIRNPTLKSVLKNFKTVRKQKSKNFSLSLQPMSEKIHTRLGPQVIHNYLFFQIHQKISYLLFYCFNCNAFQFYPVSPTEIVSNAAIASLRVLKCIRHP